MLYEHTNNSIQIQLLLVTFTINEKKNVIKKEKQQSMRSGKCAEEIKHKIKLNNNNK